MLTFNVVVKDDAIKNLMKNLENIGPKLSSIVDTVAYTLISLIRGQRILRRMEVWGKRRTFELERSFVKGRTVVMVNSARTTVYSRNPYAAIHETGGIVKPRRKKYLKVPIYPVAQKFGWKLLDNPALLGDSFIKKGKIFVKYQDKVLPLFVLKSSVKIPARHYLSHILGQLWGKVEEDIGETIREIFA